MLLKFPARPRQSDESGSALIAVLALMMVTAIIGVTIVTATVHGLSVTSSTRASVQSRAAAEAGIDVAVVGLKSGTSCATVGAVYESTSEPIFRANIEYEDSGTWTPGCPPPSATLVRIVSTGTAATPGVAGATSGNRSILTATYNYIPDYVAIPHIDAAVYAHTMQGDLKSFNLDSVDSSLAADLQIKNGNVNCINGARIAGDVILANGSASLKNCQVTGSIHVSKSVDIYGNGSRIFGDVIAVGQGVASGTDVVSVNGGSTIDGDIYSAGNASVIENGTTAKGNVTVAGTPAHKAQVGSGAKVLGSVISSGTATGTGTVGGTKSTAVEGLLSPPVPLIPNWTDISYPSPKWAANGYQEVFWTGDCNVGGSHSMWTSLSARTTPTVVNALNCPNGLTTESNVQDLTLKANIAFIAKSFTIKKLYAASDDTSTTRNLWFLVPDNTADGVPTCAPPGGISLHSAADINMSIAVMVYTPCKIFSDRNGFRGQLYGGEVEFTSQAKLTFAPVGIPGIDLSGGVPPTMVLDGGHLGNRVSVRELG